MTETIQTGLLLLVVGMSTVFVALGIVVYTGKGLIMVVNNLTHTNTTEIKPPDAHISDSSGAKIAVITGAVHAVTGGKGQITHIERLEE
jgi:oxaloacetate decarboxylase gamma subunit